MNEFVMPMDITGEEKMIGGVLSLRQVGYLAAGVILTFILCLIPWHIAFKIIFGALIMLSVSALAFIKIDHLPNFTTGISLDKYIILYWEFRKKQKFYLLIDVIQEEGVPY